MRNNLPISPKKKFKYSITFQSFDEESLEAGDSFDRGFEVQDDTDTIGDILYKANTTYGIYYPLSFGGWESTEPDEDRDFWEKGIRKYYFLHITNEDGTEISQEENDFITFLLSDGRYEIDKFRDYAVGGIVLGAVALGVGALITYFYFKGRKGNKGSISRTAKSVTYTINGKDRKFPIKDAWKKEHSLENKSEDYEVPQADRYEMGGDASEYYHEIEYGEGGVARAKEVITKKIGLSEENADFLTAQSEKFAIWLADSIVKAQMNISNDLTKKQAVEFLNNNPNTLKGLRQRIRGILDWLESPITPKQNLRELSFIQAEEKSKKWHDELSISGGDIDYNEPKENIILKTYPTNEFGKTYYWVMLPSNTCTLESSRMGHCGQSSYSDNLISFRSTYTNINGEEMNDSHITIGYGDGLFYQVKGKQNKKPLEKYFPYIFDFIKSILNNEINERLLKENEESITFLESLTNERKKIQDEILKHITFNFGGASSTESKFLEGKLTFEESKNYISKDSPVNDLFDKIEVLKEKRDKARNTNEYEELDNSLIELTNEAKNFIQKNIIDKFKETIRISNLISEIDLIQLNFKGFSSEYASSEDYGWEDMTKEELLELYELNPNIFTDFAGKYVLYEAGIINEKPDTTIVIEKSPEYVADLLRLDNHLSDDIIEKILTGETYDLFTGDSWNYYYNNAEDSVEDLNRENYEEVIDKIVEITGLDKAVVKENGAKHYLAGDDEEFDSDNFDDIKRAIASALSYAEENSYVKYYYEEIESALSELGTIKKLNYDGLELQIDLANLMSIGAISSFLKELDTQSLEDVFFEAESQGEIELPKLSIDDRYSAFASTEDFNANFDINNYSKGGSLRPKNINKNKIQNMKPSQSKLAQGGNILSTGISKEDYFLVVQNWVYFTFNYPMGFVKDAFGSSHLTNHLQEKFSSSYTRYGSVGVLMSFWSNLDNKHREMLSLWIKNNYFNSSSKKTQLQSISDENYAKIITHWNMFCFNFTYNFIESVFGDNTSHYEEKWVRAYESAGSTGAVNKFFTELSGDNQMLLTNWVFDNYKGNTFVNGGGVDDKIKIKGFPPISKQEAILMNEDFEENFNSNIERYTKHLNSVHNSKLKVMDVKEVIDFSKKYANGGGVESEYIVKMQNEDSGDIETINVLAKTEDEAIENALNESGLSSDYILYSVNKKFANGGQTRKNSPKKRRTKKDPKIVRYYFDDQPQSYAKGGMFGDSAKLEFIADAYASEEMANELREKLGIETDSLGDNYVISFAYTDYGGDFLDKVAIAYFSENYPENTIKENSGWGGENAFVFGEPAKEWIEQTQDYALGFEDFEDFYYEKQNEQEGDDFNYFLDEIVRDYTFDREVVIDWLMENKSGYYGMTTQGLDFSWTDLTAELVNEGLIEKTDEDEYAGGGKAEKKYYWIKMDRDKIDEYIGYASRMMGMFEGEIYTQAPNRVAFDTEDDMFHFTSMLENDDVEYEELYNGEPRPNIWDKIISNTYAKGGSTSGQWIIQDWAGNHLFTDKVFDSFEDGWDFIYENIKEETEDDGTYDDYYVVELEYDTTDYDNYAGGGKLGAISKTKIEITENEEGDKIATRTLVKENKDGEKITYELKVGVFKDRKKGYFEIYASDEEDEEYFYVEGGLWIEGGRVVDYDGVYELSEKVRPLLSALNLNSQDIYAEGGQAGKKPRKKTNKKKDPKMVRYYFDDKPYSYAGGGEAEYEENIEEIVENLEPEAVKFEGNSREGFSVLVKDKNSDFSAFVDVYMQGSDVTSEWNQYIFAKNNSKDMLQSDLQDNADVFDYFTSEAINYLEQQGAIQQDDNANWSYTDKYAVGGGLKKAKLVDEETGKEVILPYKTKNFRGEDVVVIGFTEPRTSASTGRIKYEGRLGEFYPSVAGLKIVSIDDYAGGEKAGVPEWSVTITSEDGETYDWLGFAKTEDEALLKAEEEAGFESVETGMNMITDKDGNKIEYAEGGEVEEWMEVALASLIEETGNDELEITEVSMKGNEFYATNGNNEYRVFKSEDDAERVAIEQVRDDLEDSPENFNQDWLMNYIDGRDFFEQELNEINLSYVEDVASEIDSKYANRLIDELVENGLMDEDDAESDNAEEIADEIKYDYIILLTEGQLDEGMDGLQYFFDNFGENETFGMVIDNNLINMEEASEDAVNNDGIAHFLSSYDGETLYLSNDCVAYRIN
jgi:hypothetical protein